MLDQSCEQRGASEWRDLFDVLIDSDRFYGYGQFRPEGDGVCYAML